MPEELNAIMLFEIDGEDSYSQYIPPPLDDALFAVMVLFEMAGDE